MIKPQVKVEMLEMDDPTFAPSVVKTARATLTNPTTKAFTYSVELYLGAGKTATSGVALVTIPAGASQAYDFTIIMPAAEGTYPVYLDVIVDTTLLAHYTATENVIITVAPAINVGPITWV